MATISSGLEEGGRSKLSLFDLPREIRDQIYGYLVSDTYSIVPSVNTPDRKNKGDDFRHLSILRVSKCANWEVMQLLQRSWFIYKVPDKPYYHYFVAPSMPYFCRLYDNATTRHMMNVQILINQHSLQKDLCLFFQNFAGTKIERRTFLILVPDYGLVLESLQDRRLWDGFRLHLQRIRSLTGFNTVVVQVNLSRSRRNRNRRVAINEDLKMLLMDILQFSEPALGPAVACDSVREERYDLNFQFSPLRFAAEQRRLAIEQRRLAIEQRRLAVEQFRLAAKQGSRMTFEDQRWHKKG